MKRPFAAVILVSIAFWNLENFFDYADTLSAGRPEGWTSGRFYSKCNGIAKTLMLLGERLGAMPDVVGFAEVGSRSAVSRLLGGTLLRKLDYGIVHYDSPDPRGIDCALIYRKTRLELVYSRACRPAGPGGEAVATRDILLARFRLPEGGEVAVLVNHHPSQLGGSAAGERRRAAMATMCAICDTLGCPTVCVGDFNASPDGGGIPPGAPLEDLSAPLAARGAGSAKYNGEWTLIDRCFVSADLASCRMEVFPHPSLLVRDSGHSGLKPRRTFSGPRYLGGLSDHLPIYVVIPDTPARNP